MESSLGQWALRGYGRFALEYAADGRFVGTAGVLHPAEWPEAELAFALAQEFWGQGLAVEAARAAREWAVAQHGFTLLASFIVPENTRSIRVAEKLDAVCEGMVELRGFQVQWWVHWPAHAITKGDTTGNAREWVIGHQPCLRREGRGT